MTTDVATYRLRAFVAGWLAPLLAQMDSHPSAVEEAVEWSTAYARQETWRLWEPPNETGTSRALLWLLMAHEIDAWLLLGRSVGYFPADLNQLALRKRRGSSVVNLLDVAREWAPSFIAPPRNTSDVTVGAFSAWAVDAQEDLTPDRSEFLRLLYLAGDEDWSSRLTELEEFAELLGARPGLLLPVEVVDGLAWALTGAESRLAAQDVALPCDWRCATLAPHESFREPVSRIQQLEEVRGRILAAADRIAETADSSTTNRLVDTLTPIPDQERIAQEPAARARLLLSTEPSDDPPRGRSAGSNES